MMLWLQLKDIFKMMIIQKSTLQILTPKENKKRK